MLEEIHGLIVAIRKHGMAERAMAELGPERPNARARLTLSSH